MYVSRLVALVTALAGLQILAAHADSATSERWLLAKYDVNGDQIISIDEVSEKRAKLFGFMDGDQDGEVSFGEYQHLDISKRQLLLQARFDKLDLNHDGKLSGPEYSSYLGSFDSFDQNGDGSISADEMVRQPAAARVEDDSYCFLWLCVRSSIH